MLFFQSLLTPCFYVQNWQYDENKFPGSSRRRREAGWLEVHTGGNSTINYVMPWVATEAGHDTLMEMHFDEISILTSVNDIRFLSAKSSRVPCFHFRLRCTANLFSSRFIAVYQLHSSGMIIVDGHLMSHSNRHVFI